MQHSAPAEKAGQHGNSGEMVRFKVPTPPQRERERRRAMYARVLNLGERTVLLRKNVTVAQNCDHIRFNA